MQNTLYWSLQLLKELLITQSGELCLLSIEEHLAVANYPNSGKGLNQIYGILKGCKHTIRLSFNRYMSVYRFSSPCMIIPAVFLNTCIRLFRLLSDWILRIIFFETLVSSSSSSWRAASTDLPDPLQHPSLLSITPGRSSKLHPASAESCCI